MTPEQKAELLEMLKQLTPADQRVLKYEVGGGHRCDASTNLVTCCGEKRCQACHIPHLRSSHTEAMVHAYAKFASAQTLTWKGRAYKEPVKPKKQSITRKVAAPKVPKTTKEIAANIPDNQIAEVMALLIKLGMK